MMRGRSVKGINPQKSKYNPCLNAPKQRLADKADDEKKAEIKKTEAHNEKNKDLYIC